MLDRSEKRPQTKIHLKGLFKAPVAISYDKTIILRCARYIFKSMSLIVVCNYLLETNNNACMERSKT